MQPAQPRPAQQRSSHSNSHSAPPPPPPPTLHTPPSHQAAPKTTEQPTHTQQHTCTCPAHMPPTKRPRSRSPPCPGPHTLHTKHYHLPTSTTTILHLARHPLATTAVCPQPATQPNPTCSPTQRKTQPSLTQPNPLTPFLRQPLTYCRRQRRTPGRQPAANVVTNSPHTAQHNTSHTVTRRKAHRQPQGSRQQPTHPLTPQARSSSPIHTHTTKHPTTPTVTFSGFFIHATSPA